MSDSDTQISEQAGAGFYSVALKIDARACQ